MENQKIEIISISGMCKKFKVSHMTIYRNYLPHLECVRTIGRKKYYLWDEVQEVHKNLTIGKYKIIA